jgi:hypothetical protein
MKGAVMANKAWFFSVAGILLLMAPQVAPAQTTGGTTGAGTTTPITTTTGGGGATPAGGGGGTGGSATSNSISYSSGFNSLSPVPTSQVAPTNSVALSPSSSVGGTSFTGRTAGTGASTQVPTSYNPWSTYYLNPMQPGLGSSLTGAQTSRTTNTGGAFGQPLYSLQTATTTTTPTGATASTQSQGSGFSTAGMSRAPAYVTTLSPDFGATSPSGGQLRQQLLAVLDRSSALRGQGTINVIVKGSDVTLKGRVNKELLRGLAEGLVRMTPGVSDVHNELQVTAASTTAKK